MSVIIYIKRVYVEHRHLTDIYTIVSIILFFFFFFSFLRCTMYFLYENEPLILRQQRNRLDSTFLCSRRIDIEPTLRSSSSLPLPPFFTIVLAHSSKKFIKFVVRYRAEDIDAWFNPFTIFNNGINGAKVDYIDL